MPSLRRLAIYAALTFPLAYIMGITFLERRLDSYRWVASVFGVLIAAGIGDRLALRQIVSYRKWRSALLAKRPRAPYAIVLAAFAAVILVPTIVLIPIGAGIFPVAYSLFALWLATIALAQRRLARHWPRAPRIDLVAAILAFNYAGVATMAVAYVGSLDSACVNVAASPFLSPVATRQQIDARDDVGSCFAYDVKTDASANRLFFTLKQRRSGLVKKLWDLERADDAIGVLDLDGSRFEDARLIPVAGDSTGSYPQRITVNPDRREIYVVVLDIDGHHTVRVIGYDGDFAEIAVIDLEFEPIRVYFDASRLIVLGYEGVVGIFDIATHARLELRDLGDLGFLGTLDTLAHRPDRNLYYASVVSRQFVTLDDRAFDVTARSIVGVPTIGLDYDQTTNRVWAAATLTREVLVLDGDSLAVLDRIDADATVRELAIDRARRLVVAAGYVDGHLLFIDLDTHCVVARLFIGRLARSVHIEPGSGRLFVTSSCGIFEVRVDKLLRATGAIRKSANDGPTEP